MLLKEIEKKYSSVLNYPKSCVYDGATFFFCVFFLKTVEKRNEKKNSAVFGKTLEKKN